MNETEERRMIVESLRRRLELLANERRTVLRELADLETPPYRRAMLLSRRAELQKDRDEAAGALRNIGETLED